MLSLCARGAKVPIEQCRIYRKTVRELISKYHVSAHVVLNKLEDKWCFWLWIERKSVVVQYYVKSLREPRTPPKPMLQFIDYSTTT